MGNIDYCGNICMKGAFLGNIWDDGLTFLFWFVVSGVAIHIRANFVLLCFWYCKKREMLCGNMRLCS